MSRPRHRQPIVIVGAGFAGFHATRSLARLAKHTTGIEVVLINPTDYFLHLALLPEVAGDVLDPRRIAVPLATARPGVRVLLGTVDQVDLHSRRVGLVDPEGNRRTVACDRLLLAAGGVDKLLPIPGLQGLHHRLAPAGDDTAGWWQPSVPAGPRQVGGAVAMQAPHGRQRPAGGMSRHGAPVWRRQPSVSAARPHRRAHHPGGAMSSCTRSHIVVTGTSSGIGRATALHLAAAGHHVYAGVRRPTDAPAPPSADSGEITPLPLNVTDPAQIGAAADTVAGHTGNTGLNGLVNNAGIGVFGPLEIIPIEQFRRLMEVNVTGQLAVTQAFLPLLRRARGRIVLIGSIGTRFTPPFVGPLAASKSALATMAEALRQELAPWDIRVVLIEPASVRTEAVDKLDRDAKRLMNQATPTGRALYEDAFRRLVATFAAQHDHGSPPDVVAEAVARALTASQPRAHYLVGKNSHRMAILAAALPTPVLDTLRRKQAHQPAPGSRLPTPEAAQAAVDGRTGNANLGEEALR